jgi:type IV secretion system protein TrbG
MRTLSAVVVGLSGFAGLVSGCAPLSSGLAPVAYGSDEGGKTAVVAADSIPPADPPTPVVRIVEIPKPLPLPGQLKPIPARLTAGVELPDPKQRVIRANAAARVQPTRSGYFNSMQVYPFAEGALYQVYATPEHATDIALRVGEHLGSVAAGDTARWIIADNASGSGSGERTHILVKPTRADIETNLVVLTNQRTYHLELRATAKIYMASVSWDYPEDQLAALGQDRVELDRTAASATEVDLASLSYHYSMQGDTPPWRPVNVADDGNKVYIEFPRGIGHGEMPPLYVVSSDGKSPELVNYRVRGNYMIVDRLFQAAELRLGTGGAEQKVRIVRSGSGLT